MLADGRTVPNGEVVRTDICVVGAGPAGITVARELGKAGLEVLLLERGPDIREGLPDDPETAVNVGIPYPVGRSRLFTVGGATHRWLLDTPLGGGFGRLRELDDTDFDSRSWIRYSGWPIDKSHLRSFYTRARSLFDAPWPSESPENEWDSELRLSSFNSGEMGLATRVFYFANPGVFAGQFRRELENSPRVLLLSHSAATKISCDDSPGSVSSLTVMTSPAHGYTVKARFYVLAAGGIENARILLVSTDRHPRGLGNGHDLVGRFFMEHPHYPSGYLVPSSPDVFSDEASYQVFLYGGIPIQRKYAIDDGVVEQEELSRCVFHLVAAPMSDRVSAVGYSDLAIRSLEAANRLHRAFRGNHKPTQLTQDLGTVIRGTPHIGRHAIRRAATTAGARLGLTRYTEPQLFWIRAMAEQVPNPESRVTLSSSRDHLDVPLAAVEWQLTDQDVRSLRRSQELFGRAQLSSGHRFVRSYVEGRELPPYLGGGNHHMGTTRMADSERQGVVDRNCRVHEVENLFVAGSSVFPTGGYANPTLTLLALGIRLSEHLIRQIRSQVQIDSYSD